MCTGAGSHLDIYIKNSLVPCSIKYGFEEWWGRGGGGWGRRGEKVDVRGKGGGEELLSFV